MTLCRSLLCLVSTSHAQQIAEAKIIHGSFRNYVSSLNKKCLLSQNTIRSIKTRKNAIGHSNIKEMSPKNIGVTFEGMRDGNLTMSMLWKPFVFTTCFSGGTLAFCAIWQYENVRKEAATRMKGVDFWRRYGTPWTTTKRFEWRDKLNKAWHNLSEGDKLFFGICLANILVHLAWKVPKFETTMIRYFSSNPRSNAICWPLLFSTFSHYSTLHIGMNMFALYSFSTLAINSLGKEQFLGFYLAGGVISSFTSLFFRVLRKSPNLSVGASGAILAVIGYISAKYPNLELSIIGLPMCTFKASSAITALIAFDLTGLALGWKFLDHAAHLGGACFGMFWYHWGNANIWQKREPLLHWWHNLRN